MRYLYIIILLTLSCCSGKSSKQEPSPIVSMQIIDRNGFSDTISNKDRLSTYKEVDFLSPQPFQKVLRVYGRNAQGKSSSKITCYHSNGQIWQYLEIVDGRAHGRYSEWYENGKLKINASVIEGSADISEIAKASWLFDGKSSVWDDKGCLLAEMFYDKGSLHTPSLYYHPDGTIKQIIPYAHNLIEGPLTTYDPAGNVVEQITYRRGLKQGPAFGYWKESALKFEEEYADDLLLKGSYYNPQGLLIAHIAEGTGKQALFENNALQMLIEYQKGLPEGKVEIFNPDGALFCYYHVRDGKKEGEELEFFPGSNAKPKIALHWHEDTICGQVKTWYESGALESQREIQHNKKHGLCFAWYKKGDLMLSEEYENDLLTNGSYYKPGDKTPISRIESGKGIATLYTPEGFFLRKIPYEKGKPLLED